MGFDTQDEINERKKNFILEYMKLGMDFYGAAVASECSPEFIAELEKDELFQQRAELEIKLKEKELLLRLHMAAERAERKGDTKGTERLLEILNGRYSKTTKLAHQFGNDGNRSRAPKAIEIKFVESDGTSNG